MGPTIDDAIMVRVRAALGSIDTFGGVGLGDIAVAPLAGSSKSSFVLTTVLGRFVLRLPRGDGSGYLEPAVEIAATRLAHKLGIGAEFVYAEPSAGLMIIHYVERGETLSAAHFRGDRGFIADAARLLAQLHGAKADLPRRYDPAWMLARYRGMLVARGAPPPDLSPALARILAEPPAETGLRPLVLAHCDPVPANFIAGEQGRLVLIDWEYAAMNDPAWDLAYLSVQGDFDPGQEAALLASYGEPTITPDTMRNLKVWVAAIDGLWGLASAENADSADGMRRWALDRLRLAEALAAA